MIEVGVLGIRECQGTYFIDPPDEILIECQSLFGSKQSGLKPAEVFIAIKSLPSIVGHFQNELNFLLHVMRARLCSPGVFDSEEGRLIRLAIAFSRRISLQPGDNRGYIVHVKCVHPGVLKIHLTVRIQGPLQPRKVV